MQGVPSNRLGEGEGRQDELGLVGRQRLEEEHHLAQQFGAIGLCLW